MSSKLHPILYKHLTGQISSLLQKETPLHPGLKHINLWCRILKTPKRTFLFSPYTCLHDWALRNSEGQSQYVLQVQIQHYIQHSPLRLLSRIPFSSSGMRIFISTALPHSYLFIWVSARGLPLQNNITNSVVVPLDNLDGRGKTWHTCRGCWIAPKTQINLFPQGRVGLGSC